MLKLALTFSLLMLLSGAAFGGDQVDDAKWKQWVPAGWKLAASAVGDLNQGGRDDAVLVLEEDNPKKYSENLVGSAKVKANLNTRRLLVLFQKASGYGKAVETDRFIPSPNQTDDPCTFWVLEHVHVHHRQLHVSLHRESACGSGPEGDSRFVFGYENERFRLVGLDTRFMAGSTDKAMNIDYLTGMQILTSGNVADKRGRIVRTNIPEQKRYIYLDEMKPAYCYDLSEYFSSNKCQPD